MLAATTWLSTWDVRYLVAALAATAVSAVLLPRLPARGRLWGAGSVAVMVVFSLMAMQTQRELAHVRTAWPAYRAALLERGMVTLRAALEAETRSLRSVATRALDAPSSAAAAFDYLGTLEGQGTARGVVILRSGRPQAWAGRIFVSPDSLADGVGSVFSPFYVTLYASATRGDRRAVATTVVHAESPADHLTTPLDAGVSRPAGMLGYEFYPPSAAPPATADSLTTFSVAGVPLFAILPDAANRGETERITEDAARRRGMVLVTAALLLFVAAAWSSERRLSWRLMPLGIVLGCLVAAPLNELSSLTALLDPTVYVAPLGGALTASLGALAITGATALIALLLALRASGPRLSRLTAGALVLALIGVSPFLLRELAGGITPPPGGETSALWLAWEVALFLAAASLLVAVAMAGSVALNRSIGGSRGLHPAIALSLAGLAAATGPLVLRAPAGWPDWYPILWMAALTAVALMRRHRAFVLTAATVAALGSATLTWNADVRGRAALADRDVAGLASVEPFVREALDRFGTALSTGTPPVTEASLLQRYVQSDLDGTGYPVALASWATDTLPTATVSLAPFDMPLDGLRAAVAEARRTGTVVSRMVLGEASAFAVLAVPHGGGSVTSVAVGPRTRRIPDDPFSSLLGLEPRETGAAPYALSLTDVEPAKLPRRDATRWQREGTHMHGDRLVETRRGQLRAHVEVEIRSPDVLLQRGTLVTLFDLIVIVALWMLSVLPDGSLGRWMRARVLRWSRSYRARLTVALFGFFVLPAAAFAVWSYRRLQVEDRESRELLVRETLRAASASDTLGGLEALGDRLDTPLMLYRQGALSQTSERLYRVLTPTGRFLLPEVFIDLRQARELFESRQQQVGQRSQLFGYYLSALGPGDDPVVLAAPARGNEEMLDQRRRDLGVLVLFATALGALGALWLSGIAARSLALPIGRLRAAALAIAGGEREPPLPGQPPVEFAPVFSAFRRMAADLGESRAALEAAQRRTATTLRNVASGVIALDREGRVTLANPRADALLPGVVEPGASLVQIAPPVLAAQVAGFLARSDDEEAFDVSLGERQLQARLTRLATAGGGAVLTLDDVTDVARAQRVLAWGEMARQVAHEIKNPLTPIRLGVQHLRRARTDGRADFDQILERNVERILAEIDRLDEIARSFSRYGSAPAERAPAESIDVAAITRDVVELERLGWDGVDWRAEGTESAAYGSGREDELREVLLNVLENARLADARSVAARVDRDAGDRVAIEVRDDGRGIPAPVLPRIFEPHFSTRTSGSGLGLAISRQLVEAWGGEISIASTSGAGTVVRITLRAAR